MPIVRYYLKERENDFKNQWEIGRFILSGMIGKEISKVKFDWDRNVSGISKERWEIQKAWVRKVEEEERKRLEVLSKLPEDKLKATDKLQVQFYLKNKEKWQKTIS